MTQCHLCWLSTYVEMTSTFIKGEWECCFVAYCADTWFRTLSWSAPARFKRDAANTTRVSLVRDDNGEFQMKHLLDWKQPREPACLAQMIINTPAVCPAPNKPRVTKHILSWAISFNNSPVTIHLIWLPISANVIIAGRGASVTVDSIKL